MNCTVQWRQTHHRPKKPLPHDVGMGPMPPPKRQRPARKSFFDFVISCICLGLPYIFFERHRLHRYDEESGFRQSAPLFVIGACTCLVVSITILRMFTGPQYQFTLFHCSNSSQGCNCVECICNIPFFARPG